VDDTLFFRPKESDIDIVLRKLRKFELELNVEDDESGFLGVHIKQLDGNRIDLTQTGLLKRVLEAMGIEGANPKATPAETEAFPAAKIGMSMNHPSTMQELLDCYNIYKDILDLIAPLQ